MSALLGAALLGGFALAGGNAAGIGSSAMTISVTSPVRLDVSVQTSGSGMTVGVS